MIGISPKGSIALYQRDRVGMCQIVISLKTVLDHLLPGELVLADRGFNVLEAAGLYCADIKGFLKKLSTCEVDKAHQVRIHVERVFGLLRLKNKIVGSILLISLIIRSSHIVQILSFFPCITHLLLIV